MTPRLLPLTLALLASGSYFAFRSTDATAGDAASGTRPDLPGASQSDPRRHKSPGSSTIDWSGFLKASRSDNPATRLAALQKLRGLDDARLLAALGEVEGIDAPADTRQAIAVMLLHSLGTRDPGAALAAVGDSLADGPRELTQMAGELFRAWLKRDPAAALAWFDHAISDGTFDPKGLAETGDARIEFERKALRSLIDADPDAAARRLAALPEAARREIFQWGGMDVLGLSPDKAAALVRGSLPEADRPAALAGLIDSGHSTQAGIEATAAFLDRIEATPAERAAASQALVEKSLLYFGDQADFGVKDLTALGQWLGAQSVSHPDRVLGELLGAPAFENGTSTWASREAKMRDLDAIQPSDDRLSAFLSGDMAARNPASARSLADLISDPALRKQTLGALERRAASVPPAEMPEIIDTPVID